MIINYKGTRWFKCDLHLHTIASNCFQDKTVTAEQWVQRAIDQGLNCVAVTDHNTGLNVDDIKTAAEGKGLFVFPAVEITCDSSQVHLLILFDVTKNSSHVRDFLVRAGIKAEDFGKQGAATIKSIFDIGQLATSDGALVIPAHIDEYNGLGSISAANIQKFYNEDYINAVQVVHKEFLNSSLKTTGNTELKQMLNDYYSNPTTSIDDATVKEWFAPVKYAIETKLAILTFSDNPHDLKNPKHGLAGIGSRSTWIKMDEEPSLEGLRQAFLLPEFRVKNGFDCQSIPYDTPELWIKSLSITNCLITHSTEPLFIEFSPQLTTIIGGRGSGKSSVLKFIRGLFNRTSDLSELPDILKDHTDFYKRTDGIHKKGVLNENTHVTIEFVRNGILHRFHATNIINCSGQNIKIERYEKEASTWVEVKDEAYIDFFEFEHYSQKQIYEIAQEPNSLRERIDKSIPGLDVLKGDVEVIKRLYIEKSSGIRTIQQQILGKGKLQTEIKDIEVSIKLLQQSGIAELLTFKEKFSNEYTLVQKFIEKISERESMFNDMIKFLELKDIDYSGFDQPHSLEIQSLSKDVIDNLQNIIKELRKLKADTTKLKTDYDTAINNTNWREDINQNAVKFDAKKLELEKQGINSISNFEILTQSKIRKDAELKKNDYNRRFVKRRNS